MATNEEIIWKALKKEGFNDFGVAGLMGNLMAESSLNANNLQGTGNKALGVTDEEFTQALNSGKYSEDKFLYDHFGYGLAQWTYWSRKKCFYDFMKKNAQSFDDVLVQVDFLLWEMRTSYKTSYNICKNAKSIKEAAEVILKDFEKPADQSDAVVAKRTAYGQAIYDRQTKNVVPEEIKIDKVKSLLNEALALLEEVTI